MRRRIVKEGERYVRERKERKKCKKGKRRRGGSEEESIKEDIGRKDRYRGIRKEGKKVRKRDEIRREHRRAAKKRKGGTGGEGRKIILGRGARRVKK